MAYDTITYEVDEQILTLTLNRPTKRRMSALVLLGAVSSRGSAPSSTSGGGRSPPVLGIAMNIHATTTATSISKAVSQ